MTQNGDMFRYAEIDEEGLEIKMSKTRSETDDKPVSALVANIPLKNIKERYRQNKASGFIILFKSRF